VKNRLTTILSLLSVGVLASNYSVLPTTAQNSMAQEVLNSHNQLRSDVGAPPLTWSDSLASDAQAWANELASKNLFQHGQNSGQGENLWMGTSNWFSFTQMVESWGSEKKYYIGGTFPNVSSTGNWSDVGHYTQIIWGKTTHVGCGGADSSDGNYRFVCRYSPPGNVIGQPVVSAGGQPDG
jgi:Cysteine-rich secretory protein family